MLKTTASDPTLPAATPTPALGASRTALLVVLGAETVFFGTLLASYLFLHAGPSVPLLFRHGWTGALLPSANTLVLLLSAWTASRALASVRLGRLAGLRFNLDLTLALGLLFVAAQVLEFSRLGLQPTGSILAASYLALVGFHALHVLAGVVVLAINALRARLGDFSPRRHTAVQVGTWFWYYVTGVWVVLFVVLYWL